MTQPGPTLRCSCGALNQQGASFCAHCGLRLTGLKSGQAQKSWHRCERCREGLQEGFEFCPHCGKVQTPAWYWPRFFIAMVLTLGVLIACASYAMQAGHGLNPAEGLRLFVRQWLGG